jgi:hypothetical protein
MMPRFAHQFLCLSLALLLAATGLVAASARGQTVVNGQVVILCSGGGPVQLSLDASGNTTGPAHLCPDLALGLLAALDLPQPGLYRPQGQVEAVHLTGQSHCTNRNVPTCAARGPPFRV